MLLGSILFVCTIGCGCANYTGICVPGISWIKCMPPCLQCIVNYGANPYFGNATSVTGKQKDCMSCTMLSTGVDCRRCEFCVRYPNPFAPCPSECKVGQCAS